LTGFSRRGKPLKPTRLISPPGTYFVTSSTWQRRQLFRTEPWARLFLKVLYGYRRQGHYALHAFVLMPEHFHLLLTPVVTVERALQLIKGGYSHAAGQEFGRNMEIWQRGFTDHRIRDVADFQAHRDYIHRNPVERGLVAEASQYRYCSAYPGFRLDEWFASEQAGRSQRPTPAAEAGLLLAPWRHD